MLLSYTENMSEAKFFNMSYLSEFKKNIKESNNLSLIYANQSCFLASIDKVQITRLIPLSKTLNDYHGFILKFNNYQGKSKECSVFELHSLKTNSIVKIFILTQENRPFGNFKMITAINAHAIDRIIKEISKDLR